MAKLDDKNILKWIKFTFTWLTGNKTWKQRQAPWLWAKVWALNWVRTAIYSALIALVTTIVWLLSYISVEAWNIYNQAKTDDANLEAFRNLMLGLGALVIGPLGFTLALVRTVSAWKQARVADQKLQTETFSYAIDQLAHDKLAVRLGAIYALEGLAKNSPNLHISVFEALCAYVREKSPTLKPTEDKNTEGHTIPADIQTILTVIGRRNVNHEEDSSIIDLSNSNLSGAKLFGFNMRGTQLVHVRLNNAELWMTDLEGANLNHAKIENAIFAAANLKDTCLIEASLKGSILSFVQYNSQTDISSADLRNVADIGHDFRRTVKSNEHTVWPDEDDETAWKSPIGKQFLDEIIN